MSLRVPVLPRRFFSARRFSPTRCLPCYNCVVSPPRRAIRFPRMGSALVDVKDRIELTEGERKIFTRLLDVVQCYKLGTTLRVAGGWVRDKLLGKECYDIDIALDNMLGRDFCEKVNEFQREKGEDHHKIGVIQCNPDQSKHLETARLRLFGTWIDFVNLRSETYAENSRIPAMEFGTAEQDAYRRDLTINSLFYNVNNDSIEDFTQRGLEDLKHGCIATPLAPKATFLDDPLRVLRAIRFAARFNFLLVEELKVAASDSEVKTALAGKISRERIGHEVDLMMSDKRPATAMAYICDLDLFCVVFAFPETSSPPGQEGIDRQCLHHIESAWALLQSVGQSLYTDEHRRLYLYAALFLPLRDLVYMDKKKKEAPVTSYIIRESLKLKGDDAETVASLHQACAQFIELISLLSTNNGLEDATDKLNDEFLEIPSASVSRVVAGLLLRQMRNFWRIALLTTTLLYPEAVHVTETVGNLELYRRELYLQVETAITKLDLDQVWNTKLLLDGKEVMKVLQLKSGGPAIGKWQQRVLKWQLANPSGTKDECIEWIEQSQTKRQKTDCSS